MIVTTSQNIERHPITEYLGIVSASDYMSMDDIGISYNWQKGVNSVVGKLMQQAARLEADAVIAVCIQQFNAHIYATGTAVRLGHIG